MTSSETLDPSAGPLRMRAAVADFVTELHRSYADAAALLPPGEQARLPLFVNDRLTVIAAGAGNLHILATEDRLPDPQGQEVEVDGELPGGLNWTLRFVDPVIAPALGLLDEREKPALQEVRRILGIHSHVYHLVVAPGGSLSGHHAAHAGTGLAHSHAAAVRDFESIRAHATGREFLVDELASATATGLPTAAAILAAEIAPRNEILSSLRSAALAGQPIDLVELRKAVLQAVRPPQREVTPR